MRWKAFIATAVISLIIVFFQWSKLKQVPNKDKTTFIALFVIVLTLSMFDLEHINGPAFLREQLLKPFAAYMQK